MSSSYTPQAEVNTSPDKSRTSPERAPAEVEHGTTGSDDTASAYPGPVALVFITIALCFSVFLVALDQTILATAIPRITDQFQSLHDIAWYGSAYLLTMSCFQLPVGQLYSLFSLKWIYIGAIFVFEIGSAICGSAPNSTAFIFGRAIAGLGCSGLVSGALTILANSVPLRKRPIFAGIIGSMFAVASVCGPPLGGALTDRVSWRWCFYINLPIGAVTLLLLSIFFNPPHDKTKDTTNSKKFAEIDFLGMLVLFPGIICLILGCQWGGTAYDWNNWRIILLFSLGGVLFICFIVMQIRREGKATIPPRIITQRTVACASVAALSIAASFINIIYYLPIYFQVIKGVTAERSGTMILAIVISDVICSILAGTLVTKLGYYVPFMLLGGVLVSIGAGLIHTFLVDTPRAIWIGYQVVFGAGNGMVTQQPMIAVQAVLDPKDIPVGMAIIVFFQTFGPALFLSIAQSVFQSRLLHNLEEVAILPPNFDVKGLLAAGATELRNLVPAAALPAVLVAYNNALTDIFIISIVMAVVTFLVSCGMEWVSVKGKSLIPGTAGEEKA